MRDDRHGRLRQASGDARRRPPDGFRARDRGRFRQLVDSALLTLPPGASRLLAGVALHVEDVPVVEAAAMAVPLAEARASGARVERLVVYRRPVEARAADRDDLVELLRAAILDALADALGADPEGWEED